MGRTQVKSSVSSATSTPKKQAGKNKIKKASSKKITTPQKKQLKAGKKATAVRTRNSNKLTTNDEYIYFASESVGEGHPDKLCDQISDGIIDACFRIDPNAKVAMETAVKTGMVSIYSLDQTLLSLTSLFSLTVDCASW